MKISDLFVCWAVLSAGSLLVQAAEEAMFPFVIPGLSVPPAGSVVDVSWLNDRPAGGHGFVRARDGHFVDGRGKRLRFLASNFTFGSCFPDHDIADKLAMRLASLGINCIRFHHTDNQVAPGGIWKAGTARKNEFDPGQLDRLDYFIAALKRQGIYANINLHISRNYWEGEDFPDGLASNRERQTKLPNYGKAIDKINDQMIRMQRDYARALLTHVNPYTHTSYTKEPCVAMVEINNENSLLQLKVESLPEYYRADVLRKWNLWLKNLTLRHGGSLGLKPGESVEAGNVEAPSRTQGSPRGLAWTRFLAETERAYTDGMRAFLKRDLGVEAAIIDTQASYGGIAGTYRESFNDFVDMHAYWQHPSFPGRPWDSANWTIHNTPMADDKSGGNLARLGIYRVAGKPFTVTEYDHPAPSHYAAEMFPMVASYAALQDWDGLFQFDWGGTDPDARRIAGYFSLQQHPAKLAFLPAAALMFRRGDVEPARGTARLTVPEGQVTELTADNVSMSEAWKKGGVSTRDTLTHRLELRFTSGGKLAATVSRKAGSPVSWDGEAGLYLVDAPAAKALVGRCTGRTTKLKGAEFEVKTNSRNFAVLTLNAADGQPLAKSRRLLLVAAGNVENTGMGWNADHTSVGTRWGSAPTICEGIAAKVALTTAAKAARVHALDGTGARAGEVPATLAAGQLSFEIGPQFKTLWYEVVAE